MLSVCNTTTPLRQLVHYLQIYIRMYIHEYYNELSFSDSCAFLGDKHVRTPSEMR